MKDMTTHFKSRGPRPERLGHNFQAVRERELRGCPRSQQIGVVLVHTCSSTSTTEAVVEERPSS